MISFGLYRLYYCDKEYNKSVPFLRPNSGTNTTRTEYKKQKTAGVFQIRKADWQGNKRTHCPSR